MTKTIGFSLGLAAFIIASALGANWAENAGLIGDDGASRISQTVMGLVVALYGNFMPKTVMETTGSLRGAGPAQRALRVGGWAFTLAGLAYAGLWAFTPLHFANIASMAVIMAALALTVGHAVWAFAACRRARTDSASHG